MSYTKEFMLVAANALLTTGIVAIAPNPLLGGGLILAGVLCFIARGYYKAKFPNLPDMPGEE